MSSFGEELLEKKHFENADRHPDILTDIRTDKPVGDMVRSLAGEKVSTVTPKDT